MRLALTLLPVLALAQPPDIAEILRRSDEAGQKNAPLASLYAYREDITFSEFDKNGKEKEHRTETWDVIGLEGAPYRKLILRDGKPLSTKEQKSEDQRQTKEAEKRRKERGKPPKSGTFSYTIHYNRDSAKVFDFSLVGEETLNGRLAYVLEGIPKPSYKPANDNEKELQHYRIKQWIDKTEFQLARQDLEVVKPGSRMQEGSVIRFSSRRLDDGVWVGSEYSFGFNLKFLKVMTARGSIASTSSDFHKFATDSRIIDVQQ